MKRILDAKGLLWLICIVIAAVFAACDKDEENGTGSVITAIDNVVAIVENGDKYNAQVVEVLLSRYYQDEIVAVATADFVNGGFSLELPKTVDEKYLEGLEGTGEEFRVSNKNVKIALDFNIRGITVTGAYINFVFGKVDGNTVTREVFWYADGDLSITGSTFFSYELHEDVFERTTSFSASLKKGWNILYITEKRERINNVETTTTNIATKDPGGLKWYAESDFLELR